MSDERKRIFAKHLWDALTERGWNQSEFARQATLHMPIDKKTGKPKEFTRDQVSKYVRGKTLPYNESLHAMCKALNMEPSELIPGGGSPVAEAQKSVAIEDMGNGTVWLRVNQPVSWPVAIKVMELVKGEHADPK
jgi:transcriptional regulator with XRE-family HTH domain